MKHFVLLIYKEYVYQPHYITLKVKKNIINFDFVPKHISHFILYDT